MYCSPYFLNNSTTPRNFRRSASDAASLAYLVFSRYLRSIVFRNASPLECFAIHAFTACRSCGLSLRMATARLPPDRTATSWCTLIFGNTLAQNCAR